MIKLILIDKFKIVNIVNMLYSQINQQHLSEDKLLELLLNFDTNHPDQVSIWNFLDDNLPEDVYSGLDYTLINEIFEMCVEMIQTTLNESFKMPHSTLYTFNRWVNDAICLNIVHDDDYCGR